MNMNSIIFRASILAICVGASTSVAAPAKSSHRDEGKKAVEPAIDQEMIARVTAEQRKQLSPLFEQERARLAAINNDRRMDSAVKKDAIRKIEKEYRDKRNAARLKMRMELRSRLLGENAR